MSRSCSILIRVISIEIADKNKGKVGDLSFKLTEGVNYHARRVGQLYMIYVDAKYNCSLSLGQECSSRDYEVYSKDDKGYTTYEK